MVDSSYFRLKAMIALICLTMVAGNAAREHSKEETQLTSTPVAEQKLPVTVVYQMPICEGLKYNTDPDSVYASREVCGG